MHFVITPTSYVQLAIIRFKDTLPFSNPILMLSLVLVVIQIICEPQSFLATFLEHALIAEPIFKQHRADTMHLTFRIDLPVVHIILYSLFVSLNSLNY